MVRSWRHRRSFIIITFICGAMFFIIAIFDTYEGATGLTIYRYILAILLFISLWWRNKNPFVVADNEKIVINQIVFYPKVIEWGNIREIKKITRGKIILLVQDRDFTEDLLLKTVNIWLGNINRDERESLIQTIKDRFEFSRKPQEILPANQVKSLNN